MTNDMMTMSQQAIKAVEIIQRVLSKQISKAAAAQVLYLTTHQVRNLKRRFLREDAQGLISKQRGKLSN